MKKWVHIIGVAGKATAALAKIFREDLGWKVTGSDQAKIYDPARSYLRRHKIKVFLGYRPENLSPRVDLVIIGGSSLILDSRNPEYLKAQKLGLPILSHSQAISRFLVKKNSVCIAGTYGKTTITALTTWLLRKQGLNPSYFIGDQPLNLSEYACVTDSSWSVTEADEYAYRRLDFDPGPRFLHYKPRYAIVTAAQWEHKDVYATEQEYIAAFQKFVSLIPRQGLLLANWRGENVKKVVTAAVCPVKYYSAQSSDQVDWKLEQVLSARKKTKFLISGPKGKIELSTSLLGHYNLENILAAVALAAELGVKPTFLKEGVASFKGIKRRLELIARRGKTWFYDDFAQSGPRVKAVLAALKERFADSKILAIFDPHAGFLQKKNSLPQYRAAFAVADEVLIARVTFRKGIPLREQVSGSDLVKTIKQTNDRVYYFPTDEELVEYAVKKAKGKVVLVFFSSGGLRGERMKKKIIAGLKKGDSH